MHAPVFQLYRRISDSLSYCFNIETTRALAADELERLRLILADGLLAESISDSPLLEGERVVEIGPRLNFATAWSTNML